MRSFRYADAAEGKKTGARTSVGFFIPLPVEQAAKFPPLGDNDKSDPHVTFLYVGSVTAEDEQKFLDTATRVFKDVGVVQVHQEPVEYFIHPAKERRVAVVPYRFSQDLSAIRWKLRDALIDAGFQVDSKFPLIYQPHTTLAYLDGLETKYEGEVPTGDWSFDAIEIWGLPKLAVIPFGKASEVRVASRYLRSWDDDTVVGDRDFERVSVGMSLILAQNVIATNPFFNDAEIKKYLRLRIAFHPEFAEACEVVANVFDGTSFASVSPALRRVSQLGPRQFQQSLVQVVRAFKKLGRIRFQDVDDRRVFRVLRTGFRISQLTSLEDRDEDYYRSDDEFRSLAQDLIRFDVTPPQLKTLFRKLLKLGVSGSVLSLDTDPGAWFLMRPEERVAVKAELLEVQAQQDKLGEIDDPDTRYKAYQESAAVIAEIQTRAGVNKKVIEGGDAVPLEVVLRKESKQQRDAPTDFVITSFIKEMDDARRKYPQGYTRLTDREWQKLRTILSKVTTFVTLQRVIAEAVSRNLLADYDLEGIQSEIQRAQKNLALKEGVPLAPMTWTPATEEEVRERHGVGQIRFDPSYTEKKKQEVLGRVDRAISDLEIVFGKGFCGRHAKRLDFKFEDSYEGLTMASYFAWGNSRNNWQPQVKFGPEFEGVLAHELSHFLDDMLAFQIEKATTPEMPAYSYGDVTHGIGTLFLNTSVPLEYILQNSFSGSSKWSARMKEFPEIEEFTRVVVESPAYQNWKNYIGGALESVIPDAFQKVMGQSIFEGDNRKYLDVKWKSDLPPGVVEEAVKLYRELMNGDVRKLTYYESGVEVWARMCEQYVYTKLARVGITNPWLTQMSYEDDPKFMDQKYFDEHLAPVMDRLFKRLKERQVLARKKQAMTDSASKALMQFLSGVATKLGVGRHVYVVGGAVRNWVLKEPVKDIDIVIDSVALDGKDSDWFAKKLREEIPTETSHVTNNYGVAILRIKGDWEVGGVNLKGEDIEIANARKESYGGAEGKGYKPHAVEPATIHEDLVRREFSINTLLWRLHDLADGPDKAEILDLTGCGMKDLNEGVVKCPRDPDIVFNDDASRMVRAIKFLLKYGLRISPDVEASIRRNKQKLWNIPPSHLSNMLIEVFFEAGIGKKALLEMKRLGLLEVVHDIAQKDKAFRLALSHWADRRADLEFLFDLMDLGMPTGRRLSGFSPQEKDRIREITVQMTPADADAFVEILEQPGKLLNMPGLIEEYGFKGPDIQRISDAAKEALLLNPILAASPVRLTKAVKERLGGSVRVARQTENYTRLEALVKTFRAAFPRGWGMDKPAKGQVLADAARQLHSALVFQFEDPKTKGLFDSQARKKLENFRKFLDQLAKLPEATAQVAYLREWGGQKGAWEKVWEYTNFALGVVQSLDVEVEASFTVGSWKVALLTAPHSDWTQEAVEKLRWVLSETTRKLTSTGLGSVVGGRVNAYPSSRVPVSGMGSGSTIASYNIVGDLIRLAGDSDSQHLLRDLIHELGHRYYFRVMGTRGKAAWTAFFGENVGAPDVDSLIRGWEQFVASATGWGDQKYGRYLEHYLPKLRKSDPDAAMWLRLIAAKLPIKEDWGNYGVKKGTIPGLDQLIAKKSEVKVFLHPVTAYSGTSPEELFAEAFAYHVTVGPRRLPELVQMTLQQAVPQLRLGSQQVQAKTFTFNEGDPIYWGKFKNKPGKIKDFKRDEKSGDPIVVIEPDPKGQKDDKEVKLLKIRERTPKEAGLLRGYHVSPVTKTPLIKQQGLLPRRGEKGVYVWDSLDMARWFRDREPEAGHKVIWEVNLQGIPLIPDLETEDMHEWSSAFKPGQNGGGFISKEPIPRDRIRKFEASSIVARRFLFADDTIQVIDFVRGYKQITGVRRIPIARVVDPRTLHESLVIGNADIDRLGLRVSGKEYLTDAEMYRLFQGEVVVEEKVDGRATVVLHGGYTFFCESLRIQHTVGYDAVPYSQMGWPDMTVVYEIMEGENAPPYRYGEGTGKWLTRSEKESLCQMVGAPLVPLVYKGNTTPEKLPALADRLSSFGSGTAEGVVIKNLQKGVFGKFINLEFQKAIADDSLHGGIHPELRKLKNVRVFKKHAAGKGRLRVFDFDDTLVSSKGIISVVHQGGGRVQMNSATFAHYTAVHGDELDFGAFNDIIEPRIIRENFEAFKGFVQEEGTRVVILTARPKGSASAVQRFLEAQEIKGVEVVALASSDPYDKAKWIDRAIEDPGADDVEFFDDSSANARAVAEHGEKHKNIKFASHNTPHPTDKDYAGDVIRKTFKSADPTKAKVHIEKPGKADAPSKPAGKSDWWDEQTDPFQQKYCEEHTRSRYCHTAASDSNAAAKKSIQSRTRQAGNKKIQGFIPGFLEKIDQAGPAAGIWLETLASYWETFVRGSGQATKDFEKQDFNLLKWVLFGGSRSFGKQGKRNTEYEQLRVEDKERKEIGTFVVPKSSIPYILDEEVPREKVASRYQDKMLSDAVGEGGQGRVRAHERQADRSGGRDGPPD